MGPLSYSFGFAYMRQQAAGEAEAQTEIETEKETEAETEAEVETEAKAEVAGRCRDRAASVGASERQVGCLNCCQQQQQR